MRRPGPHALKSEWREWAFQVRANMPDTSAQVVGHLRDFLHGRGVRNVLAYCALPGEPDVAALADEFTLFTTRTRYKPQRHLTLHAWHTATEVTKFGYLQPPADAPQVALDEIEAILLPGVAFDRQGVRLGYGGGFYDRLLPDFTGLTLGVVWAELFVSALPHEPHDVRVQGVVTPNGVTLVGL